ncbi:hypothetical protein NDU88_004467 [Pleurodeles waltl]|uniref:Uncharacterized protein n=1 Tax=Pleurodeles waltl TaxID=8319 RepID=A0AAV7SIV5_PLEWA|nr:hypothetical protein NDU88_004467 [Pleurodeles waltl]
MTHDHNRGATTEGPTPYGGQTETGNDHGTHTSRDHGRGPANRGNGFHHLLADSRDEVMRLDIANFQSSVMGLEQCVTTMEDHLNTGQHRDQELLYLRSKLVDLEDRSRRNNVCFLGFPEQLEGTDIEDFLHKVLPTLTNKTLYPPLEFQRAHRLGPKQKDGDLLPRPIIACLLRHGQARQLLQNARSHGPFRTEGYELRITTDFSKETNDRRKAFLSLRPRMRQLDVKYGLFDPARMWFTKNGVSKHFYDPEDLWLFLDTLLPQSMETTDAPLSTRQEDLSTDAQSALPTSAPKEGTTQQDTNPHLRGRDMERFARMHDDRGQVLQAVAFHTQLQDRDKPCSPLKRTMDPP